MGMRMIELRKQLYWCLLRISIDKLDECGADLQRQTNEVDCAGAICIIEESSEVRMTKSILYFERNENR